MTVHVGTTAEVIEAFMDGVPLRTVRAPVPSGRRVEADAVGNLYSCRTVVAVRLPAEHGRSMRFAITTHRYTVTTSTLVKRVERALWALGWRPTPEFITIHAAVPGRWGGFGPAWHPTGWEDVPAVVWTFE